MSDQIASTSPLASDGGTAAMSRLADRLAALAPPRPVAAAAAAGTVPRFSPAVTQALSTSAAISARAAERARRSRSIVGNLVDSFTAACAFIPYALVALALRLVMARVFFLDGQTRVEGPHVPLTVRDVDLSVVLPLQVKAKTVTAFMTQIPPLPLPPALTAYAVSYAEVLLPIMLVLGLGTRFAALGLIALTVLFQLYVTPQALSSAHVYWVSMLLVLVSLGAGHISIDALVRYIARR